MWARNARADLDQHVALVFFDAVEISQRSRKNDGGNLVLVRRRERGACGGVYEPWHRVRPGRGHREARRVPAVFDIAFVGLRISVNVRILLTKKKLAFFAKRRCFGIINC